MTSSYPSTLWWFGIILSTFVALIAMTLLTMWLIYIARPSTVDSNETTQINIDRNSNGLIEPSVPNIEVYSTTQSALWTMNQKSSVAPISSKPINTQRRISNRSNNSHSSLFRKPAFEKIVNVQEKDDNDDEGLETIEFRDG